MDTKSTKSKEITMTTQNSPQTNSAIFSKDVWHRFVHIAKPYFVSNKKWEAFGLLGILLVLLALVNGLNVVINFVGGDLMTAMSGKNVPEFYRMIMYYFGVFVVGTPIVVMYTWVQQKLSVNWRKWLTSHLQEKWLANRNYYRINNNSEVDNPDERLAQDANTFPASALNLFLAFLSSVITLFSFSAILWSISHLLVFIVVAYSLGGTAITVLLGKRLVKLQYDQLRLEANFRYNLIHVRNNTESIAFYHGEEKESFNVAKSFVAAIKNFNLLIGWQRNLGFFTTGYKYYIVLIPALIIAPLYFAGKVQFGVETQADMAFSQILTSLSLIVASFGDISNFIAVINRLGSFNDSLNEDTTTASKDKPKIDETSGDGFKLTNVTIETPDYKRILIKNLDLEINSKSGSLLIVGPSGCGKSSLLRVLAGLWNAGSGSVVSPSLNSIMFLPQRPYMVLGSLRDQLVYPNGNVDVSEKLMQDVLAKVNLADLAQRVGGFDTDINFADVLSLGEQQRLAFARLLMAKPKFAILDESSSALDVANEKLLYEELTDSGCIVISVGHRPSLVNYHDRVLEYTGDGGYKLMASSEYAAQR